MKKAICFTALLGIMISPCAVFAQTPAAPDTATTTTVIPADQQATKEQVAKLVEVMRLREQLKDVYAKLDSLVQKQASTRYDEFLKQYCGQCNLSRVQHSALDKIVREYAAKLLSVNSSDDRVDTLASLFQQHFNKEDVDASIAFYSSPAGQHILDVKPAILQEYASQILKKTQERSIVFTDEMANEMKNVIHPGAQTATKPVAK